MIFIDSDVFLIDLRYRRDPRHKRNKAFLRQIFDSGQGVTTIFNLLEICGILSFNLNIQQLKEFFHYFPVHYNVKVLPKTSDKIDLPTLTVKKVFAVISQKAAFGDALILAFLMENYFGEISSIVSWNASHFVGRVPLPVYTPQEARA